MKINDKRNSLVKHSSKTYRKRAISSIKNIAIHHSATTSGNSESFARYHVNHHGWPGIAYHYVVNKDGSIDYCHNHEVVSYHVGNSNSKAIGICMVGDFRTQKLEKLQRDATLQLVRKLLKELNLSFDDVWGHVEFPGYARKPCPSVSMEQFRRSLRDFASQTPNSAIASVEKPRGILEMGDIGNDVKKIQQKLTDAGFSPGSIDGIFGRKTAQAVREFQKKERISIDGIVGPKTLGLLF